MIKMVTTRLASSTLTIFILVTMVFFMVHLTPGGPAYSILGQKATAASVANLNARLGLDQPLLKQYGIWWWHLAQGQLGYSYLLNRPVGQLLWQYELNTLVFYTVSIVVSTVLSILLGLVQGVYFGRWPAKIIGGLQLGFYALPAFFVAAMLVLWFSVDLPWLPASGITNLRLPSPTIASYAAHLVLPVTTITLLTVSSLSRYFGEAVHEELAKDYVRTARAKGGELSRHFIRPCAAQRAAPAGNHSGSVFPLYFYRRCDCGVCFQLSWSGLADVAFGLVAGLSHPHRDRADHRHSHRAGQSPGGSGEWPSRPACQL